MDGIDEALKRILSSHKRFMTQKAELSKYNVEIWNIYMPDFVNFDCNKEKELRMRGGEGRRRQPNTENHYEDHGEFYSGNLATECTSGTIIPV